jgi:predicted TIM-barrel fold metal-dependent hydrolase
MVIDFHVHLCEKFPDKEWVWRQWPDTAQSGINAEEFIVKMDSCNPKINKAVVFGLKSLSSESPEAMKKENDYIINTVKNYPDRFIGAGLIDLSWGDKAIQELNRFVKKGLKIVKIRFSSFHYHANSMASQKMFKEIEKLGVLPVMHSDWTHYSNPLVIGDLSRMFPDLKMVMQHFGEYLSYDALSVAKKNNNLYVDTSALVNVKNIIKFMKEVSPDRIMYASDTLGIRGGLQPQDALNRILCLDLSKNDNEKLFEGNAIKLLRSIGVKV